ncbi:MAG: DUF2911 domain-containing protein [Saprospiraceae bacterium]
MNAPRFAVNRQPSTVNRSKNIIMQRTFLVIILSTLFLINTAFAQLKTPAASPAGKVIQTVGLTEIEVSYARPSAKGRTIFGTNGLVPFNEIWRTGANGATKITIGDDLKIGGKALAKGEYAILTQPSAANWTVYFYPYETSDWSSYVEKEAVAIIGVPTQQSSTTVETLSISFENLQMESADLVFAWANTKVALPISVEVKERVKKNIDRILAGPSVFDYFFSASFLHESGGDLEEALKYAQQASQSETPRFFFSRREALILADLDRKEEAITAAKQSMKLAEQVGNVEMVRVNQKSIEEWSK